MAKLYECHLTKKMKPTIFATLKRVTFKHCAKEKDNEPDHLFTVLVPPPPPMFRTFWMIEK